MEAILADPGPGPAQRSPPGRPRVRLGPRGLALARRDLVGQRMGQARHPRRLQLHRLVEIRAGPGGAVEKAAYPSEAFGAADGVRIVPGGSSVRRGARVEPGVVIMPPAYVNVGAWVGSGTMIDSHALVGSCAQVGERVHLSAAAQLGGVLEPAARQARRGRGRLLRRRALRPLRGGPPARSRGPRGRHHPHRLDHSSTTSSMAASCAARCPRAQSSSPARAPPAATTRPRAGLQLYAPCIVKYRDGEHRRRHGPRGGP